ncbi:MAG TPA: PIN domain-containing protein [Acidimicrobiales bacterium]|jgi:tRNA(fMet)-specific endonuclease VapC
MSLLLFDTTFLIDADRGGERLDSMIADDDDVAIAAITVAELRVGVALSRGKARTTRQAFVDDVLAAVPVVSYDLDVAAEHAELLVAVRKQGRPRGAHDLMIAATARATQRTVLTADSTAFADLPDVLFRSHR